MSNSTKVIQGFSVASQMPLDSKANPKSENTLKNLGINDYLVYTYHDGFVANCLQEKSTWVWREALVGEVGLLDAPFQYPAGHIVNEINYSLKKYNFFKINKLEKGGFTGTAQDLDTAKEDKNKKGVPNGYASLDSNGTVPASQLPSYVDDVLEVANLAAFPTVGNSGKIYIALDTNFMYRWSGTVYIEIKDQAAVWGAITGNVANQTDLIAWMNLNIISATFMGSAVPGTVPTGTGKAYWIATQSGPYPNLGNFTVAANSFAIFSRDAGGAFSISQTTLDITSKVNVSDVVNTLESTETAKPLSANQGRVLDLKIAQGIVNWTAKAFLINDEVSYLGKLWQANAAIISTDVPGTSSKWVEILTGYGAINDLKLKATLITGKNKFNKDDTSILQGGYLNASGVFLVFGTTYATHFIPILAGQTLHSNQAVTTAGQYHTLYDANKTFISSVQSVKTITATVDGFVKFTCSGATNINQVEVGTVATTYEVYKLSIHKDDIISVNDSAISTAIARTSDVITLITGKNKFNKNDLGILTGKYIDNLGVVQTFGTGFITHYIPIKSGQTFFCNNANLGVGIGHSFYNSSKVLVSTVTGVKLITASQDGFVRYSIGNQLGYTIHNTQVEEGTAFTTYEAYYLGVDSDLIQNDIQRASKHTEITVKRIGTSGVDANFCGLNAIGDALASITDASSINTYNIVVEGVFLFKLQSDFVYSEPSFAEPTVIIGKDWVNIEGKGKDKTIVAVELTSGQTFTGGKTYNDFQPVMWNCNSKLSNMSIIGKNCRYSIHMEAENFANNKTATFENLYVNFKGSQEMGGGAGNAIGTGMRLGQTWNFNNCEIVTIGGSPFGVHTALALLQKGGEINFTDCSFWGNIFFHNYPSGRVVNLNLNNCKFNRTKLNPNFYYTTYSTLADYMDFNLKLTTPPIPYFNTHTKGKGLKIESKSQGVSSSVKFDENSTAFNSIIGNSNVLVESRNYALNKTQFGYQWKNGGIGLNGYAIGGLDIDSANTAKTNGLGVLLGNCATVNKTLTVIVDGTTYNIVFNENFTAQNNAYVIAKITAIIGTVANVTEFCPSSEYYPDFGSMESLLNEDTTAILKGMGIVYTTNGMRRALNSDNRIDGICLYDTVIGEYGKCIKQGVIYTSNSAQRFSIAEDVNASRSVGSELGISATAGVFSLTSTPKLLRAIETNIVQII
jgi:hypothetical protein